MRNPARPGTKAQVRFWCMEERERMAQAYLNGKTLREVAEEFGGSMGTVSAMLEKMGVPRRKGSAAIRRGKQ